MDYPIILAPLSEEDGGGFLGFAPDLPGCMSDGDTMEDALANTQEAVAEWIETALRRGMDLPEPGSAAYREREEKEQLIASLKDLAGGMDDIETRLEELERVVRDIEDRLDHEDAWTRFADLATMTTHQPKRQKMHSC